MALNLRNGLKLQRILPKLGGLRQFHGKNVLVEKVEEGITAIGLNRPEVRNCVNLETARELEEAFRAWEADETSPVAVLYGKGSSFCAGLDLKEVSQFPAGFDFPSTGNYDPENGKGIGPMGPSRRIFKKPVIAAVQGYAVAGGMEITLACDLRVAEETTTFGIFCRRFGVPLIDGGTVRLPRLIGLSRALDLILTGRAVKGKEAFEIGLANRLVPPGQAYQEALKLAAEIAKFPQECMRRDRASAYEATFSSRSWEEAVINEMRRGNEVLEKESVGGAGNFVKGVGRHGSFQLENDGVKK